MVEKGALVRGLVTGVNERQGLTVELSQGYIGRVALTELSDEYADFPTHSYTEGQLIQCCVIKCDLETHRCQLSLRKSR